MKKFYTAFLPALAVLCMSPGLALAQDAVQSCTSNDQCTLVSKSCNDNCAFVPVSSANLSSVQSAYQQRCGKAMTDNPQCVMNPPLAAACINGRCTIDYPYANNAGPKDYTGGARAGAKASSGKSGTAYDLEGGAVQNTLPAQGTAGVPAAAMPTGKSMATPPEPVPAQQAPMAQRPATAQQPMPQRAAAPTQPLPSPAQAAAAPSQPRAALTPGTQDAGMQYEGTATVPAMRPTREGEPAPTAPEIRRGKPVEYVPQQTTPAPDQTTRAAVKTGAQPSNFGPKGTVIPADGTPTAKPQAPTGSVPIPPSDLKPAPTFVPPAGAAIPVSPEDPGAPPPPGSSLIMNDGKLGVSSDRSFTQKQDLRSGYTTNQ